MCLHEVVNQVFPISQIRSIDAYIESWKTGGIFDRNTRGLQEVSAYLTLSGRDRFFAHAKEHLALEEARASSVISRAQSLLVSQAFLGTLLTFGGAFIDHTNLSTGMLRFAALMTIAYFVSQELLLIVNCLRAMKGLDYTRVGSSELISWMSRGEDVLVRKLAIAAILQYREAAILNSWRFLHFDNAQKCLRNVAITLGVLVILVFGGSLFPRAPTNAPTAVAGKAMESAGSPENGPNTEAPKPCPPK